MAPGLQPLGPFYFLPSSAEFVGGPGPIAARDVLRSSSLFFKASLFLLFCCYRLALKPLSNGVPTPISDLSQLNLPTRFRRRPFCRNNFLFLSFY
jgi:hypothetical protein